MAKKERRASKSPVDLSGADVNLNQGVGHAGDPTSHRAAHALFSAPEEIARLVSSVANGKIDRAQLRRTVSVIRKSAKITRRGVTISGQGIADLLIRIAPHIRVASASELSERTGGLTGDSLAAYQITKASRQSAGVGAVMGGVVSTRAFIPPLWVMLPLEIIVETLVISAIEMRLVGELHEIYGHRFSGTPEERGQAMLISWAESRGLRVDHLHEDIKASAYRGARGRLIHLVRRRLIARAARNVTTIAPFLIGAAIAAAINRRATRELGDSVVRDLTRQVVKR